MIFPPAAIERDERDPRGLGALGDRLADALGSIEVSAGFRIAAHVVQRARRRRESLAGVIVDELRVNVLVAAEHAKPRALGRAHELRARAPLAALQTLLL